LDDEHQRPVAVVCGPTCRPVDGKARRRENRQHLQPGIEPGPARLRSVGASKAAIESLTRYLAVELARKNIIVNAVSPGIVETDALKHFAVLADGNIIQKAVAATPAGRLVTPEDVAEVVAFLCTSAASMIRGQVIVVDGGYTLPGRLI